MTAAPPAGRPPQLLAVAHGSHAADGVATVRALVDAVGAARPDLQTAVAFVDDASPSPRRAFTALPPGPVVVVPLLLAAASHSKTDVAASVQEARAGGRTVYYGRPLGPHPLLLDVAAARLADAGVGPAEPVVLVSTGSADPDANAATVATARLLSEARGLAPVEAAFASATRPTPGEALQRLRSAGHRRVAVLRYFLAPGAFPTKVGRLAGPDTVVTDVLGVHPALVALVLARYDEALAGDIRMNCDTCLYRVPVGGRADRVGAPQRPHPHPDDTDD